MDNVESKTEKQEQDFQARRRLLKASAAVPLIGTLAPGSALAGGAATSTQCDLKQGKYYEKVVKYDDHALRAQARFWKSTSYRRDSLYEVSGKFYSAVDGTRQYPRLRYGRPRGYNDYGQRYVLCYVDVGRNGHTGQIDPRDVSIAGVYPQRNTGGYAMSDSCWDSIGGIKNLVYDKANG